MSRTKCIPLKLCQASGLNKLRTPKGALLAQVAHRHVWPLLSNFIFFGTLMGKSPGCIRAYITGYPALETMEM